MSYGLSQYFQLNIDSVNNYNLQAEIYYYFNIMKCVCYQAIF